MKTSHLLSLALSLLALGCTQQAASAAPEADPVLTAPARMQADRFAFDIFRALAATQTGNVTFSPVSVEAVLRLLREGAAGRTRAELDALHLGQEGVSSAMQVQSANRLFAASDLNLKPTAAPLARAPFASAPGEAVKLINTWCAEKTQGLIPELVSEESIGRDTRLVLLNAIYLREKWLRPFDRSRTHEGDFITANGGTTPLTFMTAKASFRFAFGKGWRAVALFYATQGREGAPGCFIGILPTGDAREFAKGLTAEKFNEIRRALATADLTKGAEVTLPKMTLDSGTFSLRGALEAAGVKECFGPGADFSRFSDEKLQVTEVLQRCHVELSEEETIAAAATAAIMARGLPPGIRFDRPFVWAIGDLTTGAAPYFLGLYEGH